jgi:hypothetical protein
MRHCEACPHDFQTQILYRQAEAISLNNYYAPSFNATIELLLRRTLVRSVILFGFLYSCNNNITGHICGAAVPTLEIITNKNFVQLTSKGSGS